MDDPELLVLYDGVCGLCDRVVQFTLRNDRRDRFRFAPLQSPLAEKMLTRHGRDPAALDTFCLVRHHNTSQEEFFTKGAAAILLLRGLGFPWNLAAVLSALPVRLLDWGYDQIAQRRYRWFGKYDSCRLPDPTTRTKFLDSGYY